MAQDCTCETDDPHIDQLHITWVQRPQRSLAVEILTIYDHGDLGRKEPEDYFLRPVHG